MPKAPSLKDESKGRELVVSESGNITEFVSLFSHLLVEMGKENGELLMSIK